ncbi:hypothetical protein [Methanococcoides burtonii]|uniref:Uncharacterized protein n=1 Tax=Methanococcoides burtonii (strain DSM 6242 / NBRC 107633 / OCM 468 / ACE-M) TaxID=259564 RepID=Q12UA4_METBU|nr:hypothetical protein [Methanococcoides burtonii]ABE52972.1 Hypothetical protein Mbur_2098 [Methanococcoides burtonii DSM 6242]
MKLKNILLLLVVLNSMFILGYALGKDIMPFENNTEQSFENQISMTDNFKVENDHVFKIGENVITSKYFNTMSRSFSGTVVDINYCETGNIITIYNSSTDETKILKEEWIAEFGQRKFDLINDENSR